MPIKMQSILINIAKLYNIAAVILAFYFSIDHIISLILIAIGSLVFIFGRSEDLAKEQCLPMIVFNPYAGIPLISIDMA